MAIAKGYGLSCLNKTFVRLNAKDKKRFEKMTVKDYGKGKPFQFLNITFEPKKKNGELFYKSKKNFLNEDIVFHNGRIIINSDKTLLELYNTINSGFQFLEANYLSDEQIQEFNIVE